MIDKIALLYIQDKKILSSRTSGKDTWYIPGGKREGNEKDIETLIREIKEELDVDILTDTISYYGTFQAQAHGHKEGTFVQMTCYVAEFVGECKPSHEIEELRWLDMKDLHRISPVDQLIFKDLHEKGLLD